MLGNRRFRRDHKLLLHPALFLWRTLARRFRGYPKADGPSLFMLVKAGSSIPRIPVVFLIRPVYVKPRFFQDVYRPLQIRPEKILKLHFRFLHPAP
jgi:hypothetical protein